MHLFNVVLLLYYFWYFCAKINTQNVRTSHKHWYLNFFLMGIKTHRKQKFCSSEVDTSVFKENVMIMWKYETYIYMLQVLIVTLTASLQKWNSAFGLWNLLCVGQALLHYSAPFYFNPVDTEQCKWTESLSDDYFTKNHRFAAHNHCVDL